MQIVKAKLAAVLVSAALTFSGCGAAGTAPAPDTAPAATTAPEAVPAAAESYSTTSVTKLPELDLDKITRQTTTVPQGEQQPQEPREELSAAEKKLSEMSLEEKVGQIFVIRPEQLWTDISEESINSSDDGGITEVDDEMARLASEYHIGGYILFDRNIVSPDQVKKFTADLKEISDIPPMLLLDEEGGSVARLAGSEGFDDVPEFPDMHYIGDSGDPAEARNAGAKIGAYLKEYGFTGDLAPVADINSNPDNVVIGDRAFGDDPQTVSAMVSAFAEGLEDSGVTSCLKHFPGHGDTSSDTHSGYVGVTKTWDQLLSEELVPFIDNMDKADMIMTAHLTMENVSSDGLPASLSKEIITGKLREELGYQGIVITDALAMGAVAENYGSGQAAVLAFDAGNDVILLPADIKQAYAAVLDAVRSGEISEQRLDESVLRILRCKLEGAA